MCEIVNYSSSKLTHQARENEEKRSQERRRHLLHLIEAHLRESGLGGAADALAQEAQLSRAVEVCDNVDLDTILQEFSNYYFVKYSKWPKLVRKSAGAEAKAPISASRRRPTPAKAPLLKAEKAREQADSHTASFEIAVLPLGEKEGPETRANVAISDENKSLKPLCEFEGYNSEWREMADLVAREIIDRRSKVMWNDCVGLESVVRILQEAVVYPMRLAKVFTGLTAPWKGILLYGPPGTGKTLLAKALSNENGLTFFNVSPSTFVSKWRGESEKLIKVLFDVARLYAPSVIFVDEIDALAGNRDDAQHDASRRFKSELLTQMDGIGSGEDRVSLLATTNVPWALDAAMLRRFEKRLLLDLPGPEARRQIFHYYLSKHPAKLGMVGGEMGQFAASSENFSGSDIRQACREASMSVLREDLPRLAADRKLYDSYQIRALQPTDVLVAIKKTKPVTYCRNKYADWQLRFEST